MNINDNVRVKLTDVGIAALKERHEDLRSIAPSLREWTPPAVDDEGYTTMQLWCLMSELGHLCVMGMPLPFETTLLLATPSTGGAGQ